MSRAVIFANGTLDSRTDLRELLQSGDVLIAADGGAKHLQDFGIHPHVVIGDMDSIDPAQIEKFAALGARLIQYSKDKDQTDLELGLRFAVEQGVQEILLIGLLGGRLDQTLANILVLTKQEWESVRLTVKDGVDTAYLLRNQDEIDLDGRPGDVVSLIPLTETVSGVTVAGLRWPLKDKVLKFGTTLSISNELAFPPANVRIRAGKLLVVHRAQFSD